MREYEHKKWTVTIPSTVATVTVENRPRHTKQDVAVMVSLSLPVYVGYFEGDEDRLRTQLAVELGVLSDALEFTASAPQVSTSCLDCYGMEALCDVCGGTGYMPMWLILHHDRYGWQVVAASMNPDDARDAFAAWCERTERGVLVLVDPDNRALAKQVA